MCLMYASYEWYDMDGRAQIVSAVLFIRLDI